MSRLQKKLIKMALKQHKTILPCGDKKSLEECFTQHEDTMLFWFNTHDKTTKIITINKKDIQKKEKIPA
ncbi:MAG: hypothetical protein GF401_18145 [Chitinivibrionales bacterium]|nr:hypothetical protein [Chitinivibrionales bacterium]